MIDHLTSRGSSTTHWELVERALVQRVLAKTEGNKRQACKLLGISRPTLDRLIEKYGLANGRVKDLDLRGQET